MTTANEKLLLLKQYLLSQMPTAGLERPPQALFEALDLVDDLIFSMPRPSVKAGRGGLSALQLNILKSCLDAPKSAGTAAPGKSYGAILSAISVLLAKELLAFSHVVQRPNGLAGAPTRFYLTSPKGAEHLLQFGGAL